MRCASLILLLLCASVGAQTFPVITNTLPNTRLLTNSTKTVVYPPLVDVTNGLVSWWPFTNNSLADVIGPNSGSQPGSQVTSTTGPNGNANGAMLFGGGPGSYITCGNDSSTMLTNDMSGTFWIKPLFGVNDYPVLWRVFAGSTGGWPSSYGQIFNSTTFFWESGNGVSANFDDVTATTPANGTWIFIATTRAGKVNTIYYNGAQNAQKTFTATIPYVDGATTLNIGGDATTSPTARMIGSLAGVRLYNRALSAAEVRLIYLNGLNRKLY